MLTPRRPHLLAVDPDRSPSAPARRGFGLDWLRGWAGAVTAALTGAIVVYLVWLVALQFGAPGQELTEPISDGLFVVTSAVALGMAWRAAKGCTAAPTRRAWLLVALAYAALAVGCAFWFWYRVVEDTHPFPSVADLGYLGYYPLLLAGLLSFPRARVSRHERLTYWLDAATVLLGGGMAVWYFVLAPAAMDGGTTDLLETLTALMYPLGDLMLLFGAASLLLRPPLGIRRASLTALAVAQVANALGTLIYCALVLAGGDVDGWVDGLWAITVLSMVVAAYLEVRPGSAAAAQASNAPAARPYGPLPYLGIALGYGLLAWVGRDEWDGPLGGLIVGAVALTGVVVARQIAAHRENSRLLQEQAARRSEARFRSLVQHASDLTTVVDAAGLIQYQSPSIERVAGHQPEPLVGTPLVDLVHPEDLPRLLGCLAEVARQPHGRAQIEWRLGRSDGGWLDVETTATSLLDDPVVEGIVLNSRDVTERKALEEQLRHQAFHDALTDLANRALFHDRVEHALARAQRRGEVVAVLYLDLDNFKTINDSLGHPIGDALLVEVAGRLRACVGATDTVARLGGDEFAILLEDAQGEHSAEAVASQVAAVLGAPVCVGGQEVLVGASIGIADAAAIRGGVDELLRNADVAMYAAKSQGKGCAERFEPAMHTAVRQRLDLTADLRRAVEHTEFRVLYQPIVALASGQVEEVEALVRWQHPERGMVSPADFIPLAEETGLIVPLGRWVLEEACRQARAWHAQHPDQPPVMMSVNLSGRQFADANLVDDVARALQQAGLDPARLKLEITESVAMQDAAAAEATMRALKALGVRLAIDDFGTGYSSLHYLKRFPVDTLKIDRSFVDGLGADSQDTAIVQSVVALAKTLQLDVTGEGIETPAQQHHLRQLGVDRGQGYLFARPLPASEVAALLAGGEQTAPQAA